MIKCKKIEFYPLMTSNEKEKMIAIASNVSIKSKTKIFQKIFLHIFLPLVLGAIIYLLGRQNVLLNADIYFLKKYFYKSFVAIHKHSILLYNAPDFCWDYSLASALFFWGKKYASGRRFFPIIILALLLASEFIQLLMPTIFTFDWIDVLAAFFAFMLSYLLNYRK